MLIILNYNVNNLIMKQARYLEHVNIENLEFVKA